MLYEKKRLFGKAVLDIGVGATYDVDTAVYAGSAISTVEATAAAIDYEAENQQFPNNNTLEIWVREAAVSGGESNVTIALQSCATVDGTYRTELSMTFAKAVIVIDEAKPLMRFSLPASSLQFLRLKLTVDTTVMTAGILLAVVRPL